MNPTQLRLSISLATAVPGAAVRLRGRDGGMFYASDHPAGALSVEELRATIIDAGVGGAIPLDEVIADAEVAGCLVPVGAGLYLQEDEDDTVLWAAVSMSPSDIEAALDLVEHPPAPACIEVLLRHDPDLGVTAIRVSSLVDLGEDPVLDVAIHVLGACLVAELDPEVRSKPR